MKKTDVIIVGAGASGLMAAYTLANAGKMVVVLEARGRIGGRIHSVNENFSAPTELGAEFVHGDLPVTLNLLKEAGIGSQHVGFEMWQYQNDAFAQTEEFIDGWDEFLQKLNQLENDMPLHDFLEQNFDGAQYAKMRNQVENYVAGYDTADSRDASAFALRNEWNHENEYAQHRVDGGYGTMVNYLANACRNAGTEIHLTNVVHKVSWKSNAVHVTTTDGKQYEADKIIIALPLGVLQAPESAKGALAFNPPIKEHMKAIHDMGFGSVIKILLEFDEVFWEKEAVGADLSNMGFLFSDETVPTYWTQSPVRSRLLTGWLGGPPAYAQKGTSDEAVLQMAMTSLSNIFQTGQEILQDRLVAWHVANWTAESYTRGSYAYDKVESPQARKVLLQPVDGTLYFTGEYLYDGPAMGTVEAALTSGKNAAEMALKGGS
ncbi:NAD(P)/FAD-dependent oxidoreductase [Flavobacterium sp. DGU11]|uniref:Tryptophan 2-monooxygenase n=1 Tax=Flavobacterium arundinis TaxID=3139143 RepID=A0ABU9HZZ6_9FLAO